MAPAPGGQSAPVDELLAIEHAGWRSLCDGTAGQFYGDVMTDGALMVLANGAVMDRDAVVAALSQSPAWSSYSIDEPRTVAIDDTTVALVYTGTGRRTAPNRSSA